MYTDAPKPQRPGAIVYPSLWSMIPQVIYMIATAYISQSQINTYQQTVSGLNFGKSPVVAIRAHVRYNVQRYSSETVIPVIHAFS